MKRVWFAIALITLGIMAAKAMPPEQQIIIFGGQSSASGGGGGGTNFLLSNTGSALLVNTGVKFLIQ